jgi:hypothetical protein
MINDLKVVAYSLVLFGGLLACSKTDDGMTAKLMESNNKVVACQKDLAMAKSEIASLRRQLAQAIANPSKVTLTDPDVIELVASLKASRPARPAGDPTPTLDPTQASRIVLQGAQAMQGCYERALKKNSALQYQQGLGVTLGITVKPTGEVESVDVSPTVDKDMTTCFKTTVSRWKFPTFAGNAVTIEQKLTLTPKT